MKGPSPLVPQGSFESQGGRKPHVRIAVYTILAVHVVVLGGLLILGCKREDKEVAPEVPTNDPSAILPFTNAPEAFVAVTNPPAEVNTNPAPFTPPVPVTNVPPVTDAGNTAVIEHKITILPE